MKKKQLVIFGLVVLCLIFGEKCPKAEFITQTQIIMTTTVTIVADASSRDVQEAFEAIKKVDSLMNHYNPKSEVSILNQCKKAKVSSQLKEVILKALYFSRITDGAFDITVGPLVSLWYRMEREKRLPTSEELENTLSLIGSQDIGIDDNNVWFKKKGMKLDLGVIAKGYAVDKAIEILKEKGVKNVLVNAGGDMYCLGEGPQGKWKVGIQHPRKTREIVEVIEISNRGVATSGDYHRYYTILGKRFGHIINPSTGLPVEDIPTSVTIIASDAITADALATGVFVLGPRKGMELINTLPQIEAMIISEKMEILISNGWQDLLIK